MGQIHQFIQFSSILVSLFTLKRYKGIGITLFVDISSKCTENRSLNSPFHFFQKLLNLKKNTK